MDAKSLSTELTILTKRLQLKPFGPEDLDIFLQLNTDPFIRKYLWDDQVISEATARDILMRNSKHFKNDRYGIWKILLRDTHEMIGFTGLWHFFDEHQPQLIYSLLKPYTKKRICHRSWKGNDQLCFQ